MYEARRPHSHGGTEEQLGPGVKASTFFTQKTDNRPSEQIQCTNAKPPWNSFSERLMLNSFMAVCCNTYTCSPNGNLQKTNVKAIKTQSSIDHTLAVYYIDCLCHFSVCFTAWMICNSHACRIDSSRVARVGDFGLARDVYICDYYRANQGARIPVKWMPPETLTDAISNERTDVVS